MDLSQAFLEQLDIRNGNRHLLNHPGDTCSQGHPFGDAEDCAHCPTDPVEDAADYRTLANHVIAKLNPDGLFALDRVEVSICMDAITAITDYVESLRCRCSVKADGSPCARCRALGRKRDEKVQR
jgi:hypothetical protein